MVSALFGASSASASASATASATASDSGSAGAQQMPETGGSGLAAPLLALTALIVGIGGVAAYVRRVGREP